MGGGSRLRPTVGGRAREASSGLSVASGLFTEVPRRGILRSSLAGSCIERPPRVARMAPEAHHAAWEGTTCCGGAQRFGGVNKPRAYQVAGPLRICLPNV